MIGVPTLATSVGSCDRGNNAFRNISGRYDLCSTMTTMTNALCAHYKIANDAPLCALLITKIAERV